MAYDVSLVQVNANTFGFFGPGGSMGFPAATPFDYLVLSMWTCLPKIGGSTSNGGPAYANFLALDAKTPASSLQLKNQQTNTTLFDGTFATPDVNTIRTNHLISVNCVTQTVQYYINDAPASLASGGWVNPGHLEVRASINFWFFDVGSTFGVVFPAFADLWVANTPSFFDLSVVLNRRKFLNADLTPVYLGSNGSTPLSFQPPIYQTIPAGGVPDDFLTNRGTGDSFTKSVDTTLSFQAAGTCTAPPTPPNVNCSTADLWFAPTTDFIDLSASATRRLFISNEAAPISLGAAGGTPTGNVPPAFFSRAQGALPDTFANNLGNGGTFTLSGGDLTDAATSPPCSLQVTTTRTPASKGVGILGDYRNGALYAWNMDTVTDNGSQRRWVRSWRAQQDPVDTPVRFNSLFIDMETGSQVPVSANPQMVLRYSDDGGHTWSDPRILSVGKLGQTSWTVKANRLGATRRNARSDRIFELSSTDQFKVSIMGADLELG